MNVLADGHWTMELYSQIVTSKEWRIILQERGDDLIVCGRLRTLTAKSLGAGMYKITKKPLRKDG